MIADNNAGTKDAIKSNTDSTMPQSGSVYYAPGANVQSPK